MASGGGIRAFYRQRKKTTTAAGVAKPSAAASKKKGAAAAVKIPPAASVSSDTDQPPALISHGSLDLDDAEGYGPEEEALRQFDMDMRYGPCLGMTRLERWERAARLGLHPPPELEGVLLRRRGKACGGDAPVVKLECLWEGRI